MTPPTDDERELARLMRSVAKQRMLDALAQINEPGLRLNAIDPAHVPNQQDRDAVYDLGRAIEHAMRTVEELDNVLRSEPPPELVRTLSGLEPEPFRR